MLPSQHIVVLLWYSGVAKVTGWYHQVIAMSSSGMVDEQPPNVSLCIGTLTFIDLAGSEQIDTTCRANREDDGNL